MSESADYRYFKYRTVNKRLIESLVGSHLHFSKPDKLNDPFDCRLDLRGSFFRAGSSATGRRRTWLESALNQGEKFFETCEQTFANLGICSFSLDLLATLMWSHYADEHRGVCLLYRFPESFFLDAKNNIFGVDKVRYCDDSLTDWLTNDAPMELIKFLSEFPKIYLTAKSPAWRYEGEARVIRTDEGLLNIPCGFLEQVCFGLRTPQADIELVMKLATDYCGCKQFCRIVRDQNSDFGITAVEL